MKLSNTTIFESVCIATRPAFTKLALEDYKNQDPVGFICEIKNATLKPLEYLFETTELNQSTYIPYVTWVYICCMVTGSSIWPFYSSGSTSVRDMELVDVIANFLEKLDERSLSKLVRMHGNALRKHSPEELEYFLFGNLDSDEEIDLAENLLYMNKNLFTEDLNLSERLNKKVADYIFDNNEFILVEPSGWETWIKPYVDAIPNYNERIKLNSFRSEFLPYSLFINASERIYNIYQAGERALSDKYIIIGKYMTSKGSRVTAQYSDGQQLIDLKSGEILSQEFNQFHSNNKRLWSLKDAPNWKLVDGLNLLEIELT